MPDWPGTPSQAPQQQWPGQPTATRAPSAPAAQWPGTPAKAAAPTGRIYVGPNRAPPAPADDEDHGFIAETGKAAGHALEAMREPVKPGGDRGLLTSGRAALAVPELLASPLTGAVRSFGGRAIQGADQALRSGATKIYGEERVPKGMTFDEAAGKAEQVGMIAPVVGMAPRAPNAAISAARNAAGVIEKIFSPETVDANAKAAVSFIRDLYGQAARHTAVTEQSIEKGWKTVNAMPQADRLNFIDYVEGRSGKYAGQQLSPELQDLADTLKTAFEQRMNKLQALPKHAQMAFIDDYFPHFWKDPNAASNATQAQSAGGAGRQGSGASLKARSIPTIADGLAQGLQPVTDNPLEATMRYVTSMDRFIASEAVMQTAKDQGYVRFLRPKTMGASGHPESFKVPDGWAPLEGRGARDAAGAQAYAPEGFARIYNNFISRGIAELDPALGDVYEAARRGANAITSLELGLSGYHGLTMMQESVVNGVAKAINQMRGGKPIEAAKTGIKAFAAPVGYARTGKKVQDVYLGLSPGSREIQKTVEMLERAGGRAKGTTHAPDYNFSKVGSYWTAMKRAALRVQFAEDWRDIKARPLAAIGRGIGGGLLGGAIAGPPGAAVGAALGAGRQIGRIIEMVAAPLFEKYIPLVKNGAFHENMSEWLAQHPNATQAEKLNAARQVWDSIDNRFGEMVQDNIFMNKVMKQAGMLSLRSWSWTVGSGRELGGAVRDVARAPFKKVTGTGPNDVRWTQKMDYAIALPLVYGTLSAIYQGLKTGKPPESIQDLLAPRTGGVDVRTGEDERLMMPGYMKDVFGFYEHPVQEATNKIGTAPKMAGQLLSNRDWRDDPIFNANDSVPGWLKQFWDYAVSNVGPISVRTLAKGRQDGSNLNALERGLGVRSAPRYLTDPEGFEQMMKGIRGKQWQQKQRHDRREQSFYGGD